MIHTHAVCVGIQIQVQAKILATQPLNLKTYHDHQTPQGLDLEKNTDHVASLTRHDELQLGSAW